MTGPELKDVRPPIDLPPNYFLLLIVAVIAVLILTALGIRWLSRNWGRPKKPAIPSKTAWEIAYEELAALAREGLAGRGEIKEYFFRLSGIVRRYIERRFSVSAPEMTTDEFLEHIKMTNILTAKQKESLREFLIACDMVKFARYGATPQEMENAFNVAKRLVEETTPAVSAAGSPVTK